MFPIYQSLQQSVWDFFLFCLNLKFFAEIKKIIPGFYTVTITKFFTFLLITQDKNRNKNPNTLFLTLLSREYVQLYASCRQIVLVFETKEICLFELPS